MGQLDHQQRSNDKPGLSPTTRERQRSYRETPEVVAAARRMIRSVGRRVAIEDPEDLVHLIGLRDEIDQALALAIEGLRRSGYSDTAIGEVFGTTKQAVQQRWSR